MMLWLIRIIFIELMYQPLVDWSVPLNSALFFWLDSTSQSTDDQRRKMQSTPKDMVFATTFWCCGHWVTLCKQDCKVKTTITYLVSCLVCVCTYVADSCFCCVLGKAKLGLPSNFLSKWHCISYWCNFNLSCSWCSLWHWWSWWWFQCLLPGVAAAITIIAVDCLIKNAHIASWPSCHHTLLL